MRILSKIFGKCATVIGIDLGTANTLVHVKGKGILLREPSVIAVDRDTKQVLAVGAEAKEMMGRTPEGITAVRPLKDGVIADFDQTEQMLKGFISKVHRRTGLIGPKIVVGIPSGITEVEWRAVKDAAIKAGASEAYTLEEPFAAAIGAGIPITEPDGSMILDIGGGTSEVVVISLGGIVTGSSLRVAGDEIDEAVTAYIRKKYGMLIGYRTAEDTKINIGSAYKLDKELKAKVCGRDLLTGLPKTVEVTSEEIREAISEPVRQITELIKITLEKTPPELAADIMRKGVVLAGGGALLRNIDKLIEKETGMPATVAPDPLGCVVMGTAKALDQAETNPTLKKVLMGGSVSIIPRVNL
ncbi:MAG: rod shape-determining protein [Abditibacteriota bacterium]|nr:rod shape-determining protein [Abditibacteriota bacterium]MBP5093641.1 rod shape-determining protein [Abditibacteriota bacterium]